MIGTASQARRIEIQFCIWEIKVRCSFSLGKIALTRPSSSQGSTALSKPRLSGRTAGNFASRIEGASKEVGTHLLVSEDTVGQLDESFQIGRSFALPVKGKSGTHTLYEVVGLDPQFGSI